MLFIQEDSAAQAWKSAVLSLYDKGQPLECNNFFRNESAAIEIRDIDGELFSPFFPMNRQSIENIGAYLITGKGEVDHEWTTLYRQRLFEENQDYIGRIISILREWPDCPRAQITVWKNDIDYTRSTIAPCLQLLWFKIINDALHLHVHMRTADCYGKLLMNFNEFISLQKHVAKELLLNHGSYVHFVDSLHFHEKDGKSVTEFWVKNNKQ
ncbi:MAG: hypothetical protein JW913_17775 [Chitinispirillaceae bacterium]|nr:hypothetical protein [Chitinispirillaceae bacterium]